MVPTAYHSGGLHDPISQFVHDRFDSAAPSVFDVHAQFVQLVGGIALQYFLSTAMSPSNGACCCVG